MAIFNLAYLARFASPILDALFPHECAECGRAASPLCAPCIASLPPADTGALAGLPLSARFAYRHPTTRRALWLLKYHGKAAIADSLGEALFEEALDILGEKTLFSGAREILLVPIPLSMPRSKQRGFNQSELLARAAASHDESGMLTVRTDVLARVKDAPPQMSLQNRTKRLENIRGAFAVPAPERVARSHIILIDDIITTGATMLEARKTLLAAGAKSVSGIAIAH